MLCEMTQVNHESNVVRLRGLDAPYADNHAVPMPHVTFTANVQRHLSCPDVTVNGATVGQVLAEVFARNPKAKSYFLDDQGGLRTHVVVFVDGIPVRDRVTLNDAVDAQSELYVMQALSGG